MAWIRSVQPMAAKLGVRMRLPNVRPRSRLAHEAAAWARTQGRFDAMHDAIFRAIWERSEDIGDINVLVRLGVSVGLDQAALRVGLESHECLPEVLADQKLASQYGVTGVPAFIYEGRGLVGVQTEESLARLTASDIET
jgi:predicted DsbA family dithiol-disulfide isomerase